VITAPVPVRAPAPAPRQPAARRRPGWLAGCYAGFAVYAAAVAIFSGPGDDRSWGIWAAAAYGGAAAIAPATRFGYFAYPAGLLGWLFITGEKNRP
jgi:hypothetical protein